MSRGKEDWVTFQILSVIVFLIIVILNVVGVIASMAVVEQVGTDYIGDDIPVKNMPYTADTPYKIYRKPANPNDDLIIK